MGRLLVITALQLNIITGSKHDIKVKELPDTLGFEGRMCFRGARVVEMWSEMLLMAIHT
jgi:hypothetical protein